MIKASSQTKKGDLTLKIDMSKVGQIRDKRTMKFFIMTVLRSVGGHARPQDLDMITMMTDSANWFDYREALAELLETQHILSVELPGKGSFTSTPPWPTTLWSSSSARFPPLHAAASTRRCWSSAPKCAMTTTSAPPSR